jgi:hypothetical protein
VEEAAVLSRGSAGTDGEIDPPGLDPPAIDPPRTLLVPFSFWLARAAGASHQSDPPDPAALRDAIAAHLVGLGWPGAEPLRWAITAVDPLRGLQLEGVGVREDPAAQECR